MIRASEAHVNQRTVERGPGLEQAITGNVVQRPLHRNAFDIEFPAIIAMLHDSRRIQVAIAGLDRVPAEPGPLRVRFLIPNFEWPGTGIV